MALRKVIRAGYEGFPPQADVLRTYAELNNGLAAITPATDLIIKAGMSKGKRNSVRSTLYNHVVKHTETWQWVQPGTFRWIGNGRFPSPSADELHSPNPPPMNP